MGFKVNNLADWWRMHRKRVTDGRVHRLLLRSSREWREWPGRRKGQGRGEKGMMKMHFKKEQEDGLHVELRLEKTQEGSWVLD